MKIQFKAIYPTDPMCYIHKKNKLSLSKQDRGYNSKLQTTFTLRSKSVLYCIRTGFLVDENTINIVHIWELDSGIGRPLLSEQTNNKMIYYTREAAMSLFF